MPRPLRPEDLHWLVCPVCHAPLQMAETGIGCQGCDRLYPVVDGLPVLLEARASRTDTLC